MESISCLQWDIMYPTWMPSDAIRSWDTMMQFCNYIQNGHATLSVFGLQHWVFLLCNKHGRVVSSAVLFEHRVGVFVLVILIWNLFEQII